LRIAAFARPPCSPHGGHLRTVFFFIFLPKVRVGIKMAGAQADLRLILLGRQTAGASPRPTKKLFVSSEIPVQVCQHPTKVRAGLQTRRRMRCPCGAPPPLTLFAESAVQSARRPLRRLGFSPYFFLIFLLTKNWREQAPAMHHFLIYSIFFLLYSFLSSTPCG